MRNRSPEKCTNLKKEGPPEIDPLARRERKQQTTIMAAINKIKKMPTAKTTIITTKNKKMILKIRSISCSWLNMINYP